MKGLHWAVGILCVFGIGVGQILFKACAQSLNVHGWTFSRIFAWFSLVGLLYLFVSLGWLWTLQGLELNRAYPLMALSFIVVPIANSLVFGQSFTLSYLSGMLIIVTGIVIAVRSS